MKERVLSVTEFKAKCLACLAAVEETGERITITKRGKPVAVVGPAKRKGFKNPAGSWAGKMEILGDIVNTDDYIKWNALDPDEDPLF
jgi:prevent-host-death family protein